MHAVDKDLWVETLVLLAGVVNICTVAHQSAIGNWFTVFYSACVGA